MTTAKGIEDIVAEYVRLHYHELAARAAEGYEEKGRGHVAVMYSRQVAKNIGVAARLRGGAYLAVSYIAQAMERRVFPSPRPRDPELERMLSDYDPKSQFVVAAFNGKGMYQCCLCASLPETLARAADAGEVHEESSASCGEVW